MSGYVLAPREPTEEMVATGQKIADAFFGRARVVEIYRAMLAEALPSPAPAESVSDGAIYKAASGDLTPEEDAALDRALYDRMDELEAREKKLREALEDIAGQKLTSEFDEDEDEHSDYQGAYTILVCIARSAIATDGE